MSERSDKPDEGGAPERSTTAMTATGHPAPVGPPPRGSAASGLTLSLVFSAFRRWWKLALPTGLLLAGVAAAVVLLTFERRYQADVWIQIHQRSPYVVFEQELAGTFSQQVVATHLELIRSPRVLFGTDNIAPRSEGLVSEILDGRLEGWENKEIPGLPKEYQNRPTPIGNWLAKQVVVVPRRRGSELYMISFVSVDPTFAKAAADGFARHYFRVLDERRMKQAANLTLVLKEVLRGRREKLKTVHKDLIELIEQLSGNGALAPMPVRDSSVLPWVGGLRDQLSAAEVEFEVRQARVTLAQKTRKAKLEAKPEEALEAQKKPILSVAQLKELIAAKEDRLNATASASRHGHEDPHCKKLGAEIEDLEAQLGVALEWARSTMAAEQRGQELERSKVAVQVAEAEVELQKTIVEHLQKRYDKAVEEAKEGNKDRLEIEFARDELGRKREVVDLLAQRIEVLATEGSAQDEVDVFDLARMPEEPLEATPLKILALACAAGLFLPFALAVFWESLVRRVHDTERLEAELQLNILGEIAQLPTRRVNASAGTDLRTQSAIDTFRESFDILGASLSLSDQLNGSNVIAVTSAVNDEGKTSVATELAASLSRLANSTTLLIDGDMRSPDVHSMFDIPAEPGLAELLSGECLWEEAVFTGWSDDLHILPAGRLAMNPLQLLGNGTIDAFLDKVRPEYRFIVIDTPPVLATSESVLLTKAASAVMLCVRWEASRPDQIRRARRKLIQAGIQPLGIVLNGVPVRQYVNRYGRYARSTT